MRRRKQHDRAAADGMNDDRIRNELGRCNTVVVGLRRNRGADQGRPGDGSGS